MRRNISLLCLGLLLLAFAGPARADAAPPLQPPGSNIAPGAETQVQMVAERVVVDVQSAEAGGVRVRADFTLRNLGSAGERMAVRFPLEHPTGMGDGYGRFPQVQGFAAEVNGQPVPVRTVAEPDTLGERLIQWAAFDVDFPVGQDVAISVTYATSLTGDHDAKLTGYDGAAVYYILETGAGWRGPIGTADIVLRLPYAVGPGNVFLAHFTSPGGEYAGSEVRWHRENLEPTREDNWRAYMVWPDDWRRILDLQAETAARPGDVEARVELARAYRKVGSDKHAFVGSDYLADLSERTLAEALALRPDSAALHAELAALRWWRLYYRYPWVERGDPADPALAPIRSEVEAALRLDPQNPDAKRVARELAEWLGLTPTPEPSPTAAPEATPAPTATIPLAATSTPASTVAATALPTASVAPATRTPGPGAPHLLLGLGLVLAVAAYAGLRR